MKQRQLIAAALMLLTAAMMCRAASPDEERMAHIRKAYAERLALMADKPFENEPFNQITVTRDEMIPGAGMFSSKTTYYYCPPDYGMEQEQGGGLYFVQEQASDVSGIRRYYREYLYDVNTMEPLFALLTITAAGYEPSTYRFYNMGNGRVDAVPSSDLWLDDDDELYYIKGPFIDQPDRILDSFAYHKNIFNAVRAR